MFLPLLGRCSELLDAFMYFFINNPSNIVQQYIRADLNNRRIVQSHFDWTDPTTSGAAASASIGEPESPENDTIHVMPLGVNAR